MHLKYRTCSLLLAIAMLCSVLSFGIPFFTAVFGASYVYGNTPSNLSNYGLVSEYKGKIYFSNTADGGRLYVMKEDGTGYGRICEDEVQYINVVADVIYYVNLSDNSALYAIGIDGAGRTRLSSDQCAYVNVVNDAIYYVSITDGWKLKTCDRNGNNSKLLHNTATGYNLNVVEQNAYYISLSDALIYRMNLTNGQTTAISSATAYQMVVYEDYVFYINATNNRVCRINASGAASQRVYTYTDYPCNHVAVFNGVVYFSMHEKGGIIGSLKVDDVYSDTDVSGIFGACLNAASSYLYFTHIYENNGNFIYYGDLQRISYDGKVTQSMADVTAAADVMAKIDGLPAAKDVGTKDAGEVADARNAYEDLTREQRGLVPPEYLERLAELEAALGVTGPDHMVSSVYTLNRDRGYVTGVASETGVSVFAAAFSGDNGYGVIRVYDTADQEVTSGAVGTGYEVRLLYNGKIIEAFTVVVLGDVNGDGKISPLDLLRLQRYLLEIVQLEDAAVSAGDANRDGQVSPLDLLRLQRYLLELVQLDIT